MGAHIDTRTFEAPNPKAALDTAERLMSDARYEYGHDAYAGHIGIAYGVRIHRTAKPLTMAAAERLLIGDKDNDGLCEKGGPAIIVRIKNKGSRKAKWVMAALCRS